MIYKILVFASCYKIIHLETKQAIFLHVLQCKRMYTTNVGTCQGRFLSGSKSNSWRYDVYDLLF